jgi:2-succinyl-5-enolpyruvyl-6-hydroxy-3-cyclohexene-1-carboxylate synthase
MEEAALKHSQTLLSGKALTELNVIARFVEEIPPDSQLFLSNSLTIRDCDRILPLYKKNIQVFQNRGASGIDGIIASALGVAADSKLDTYLIIGDLAFIYDLPAIHIASLLGINLKILLLNNNGGRIFDHLPSSQFGEVHEKYFLTRQKVVVEQVVRGYGAGYMGCKSAGALLAGIKQLKSAKRATVLEVKIDNARSMKQRKLFAGK